MRSTFLADDRALYNTLIELGVAKRRALQLQNLMEHLRYTSFCIDSTAEADMIIATADYPTSQLSALATTAHEQGCTLCIIAPSLDSERDGECKRLVAEHTCTSVDNRGYLLLFNNHLPKQKFRL